MPLAPEFKQAVPLCLAKYCENNYLNIALFYTNVV